jgi:hypothetical protein
MLNFALSSGFLPLLVFVFFLETGLSWRSPEKTQQLKEESLSEVVRFRWVCRRWKVWYDTPVKKVDLLSPPGHQLSRKTLSRAGRRDFPLWQG